MIVSIKNSRIKADVTTAGGQLTSIVDANAVEYLWQGNPEYWNGQAPPLFPMAGVLRNKRAIMPNGKECILERHGLVRKQEFSILDQSATSVIMRVTSNEETLKAFPYEYEFRAAYSINDKTLTTEFTAINIGKEDMPFTLGGHPAFNCPLTEKEKFEDYIVEFEKVETADCMTTDISTGLLYANKRDRILDNTNILPMSHKLFEVDSIPFDSLKSRRAKLYNPKTMRGVDMSFERLDYFVVWSSRNGGNFVALEPWTGLATCDDEDDIFMHKRGAKILKPNESMSFKFDVTIMN
ncbi:MAG: aldose 1-epimerase family protein [Clostridiales bacterium]|nr:aldose 1-epimerase family protein [Clostridiales bacterium]